MKVSDRIIESELDGFLYSTDKSRLDVAYIYQFLNASYWAKQIPIAILKTSIENSICIGIYKGSEQIGFARLITDGATFAWLADVFVDEGYRGNALSKKLMEFILDFEFVPKLRRVMLATRDAHGLYSQFGFVTPENPDRLMEILQADIYLTGK